MYWIDQKYANLIGSKLELFKVKKSSPFVANFRCYICGDSKKNPFKTRGYLYTKQQRIMYSCHNCGVNKQLATVLRELDLDLYNQYKLEKLANSGQSTLKTNQLKPLDRPITAQADVLKGLKKISELAFDHPARRYLDKRGIPTDSHWRLYYTPRFKRFVNSLIPEKFDDEDVEKHDEPRLILPFIDTNNQAFGFQGRAFHNKSIRYITIILDNTKPKIFGLNTIDPTKLINVVEGPIDSLFISNCLAMAGSDAMIEKIEPNVENVRIIYDNEPRNKEIVKKIERSIERGYNVFIWPDDVLEKDINDYALSRKVDRPTLMRFLEANTYRGLRALARFSQWRKC